MLLKRFTDNNNQLYVFDKARPEKGVEYLTTKGVFWEPHFYTSRTVDGEKDTTLEDDFAKLESDADPIVEKIVSAARKKENPNLTEEENNIVSVFLRSVAAHT